MNGKQAKRLKKIRRDNKKGKRAFQRLTHIQKGQFGQLIDNCVNPASIDYLKRFE